MRRPHAVLALTAALLLGLTACGDDDGDDEGSPGPTTTEAADGASTTTASTTTEAATSSTAEATASTAPEDLPGEPIDIYPYEGATLAVVGVAADDTLNVRSGPGTDFAVVAELDPLSEEAVATGQNRDLGDALWVEVEVAGTTGWVNVLYVAQAGATTDITADVPATSAANVGALAEAIAATRVGEGEGPTPTVTIVAGPTDTEVTVDVIGLADDSLKGERLRIEATPGGDGVTAATVEATALCARGVTADGLCT